MHILKSLINKNTLQISLKGILLKIWHRPTLPRVTAVPSALVGLTSLFGMGRGGHHRYRHLNIFKVIQCIVIYRY